MVHWAGVTVTIAAIAVIWVAQESMGASWLPDVDPSVRTERVTRGPFGMVRNPILSATVATVIGLALVVPNLLAWLAVPVIFAGLQVQVRMVEEPHLDAVHGAAYHEYQRRVGRFVPGIGRRR